MNVEPAKRTKDRVGCVQRRLAVPGPVPSAADIAPAAQTALLIALVHDAIAHLMNAMDKVGTLRESVERLGQAVEGLESLHEPVTRIARSLHSRDSKAHESGMFS